MSGAAAIGLRRRAGPQSAGPVSHGMRDMPGAPASHARSIAPAESPMPMIATTLVALVAAIHVYILVVEMFLWTTPYGRKVFGSTPEFAASTKVLAANQGLYNGFLAAGLIWGLALGAAGHAVLYFFLGCVFVAGLYGAATVSRRIFFVQSAPAALAAAAVWFLR